MAIMRMLDFESPGEPLYMLTLPTWWTNRELLPRLSSRQPAAHPLMIQQHMLSSLQLMK
jgi:hypothetical protein